MINVGELGLSLAEFTTWSKDDHFFKKQIYVYL